PTRRVARLLDVTLCSVTRTREIPDCVASCAVRVTAGSVNNLPSSISGHSNLDFRHPRADAAVAALEPLLELGPLVDAQAQPAPCAAILPAYDARHYGDQTRCHSPRLQASDPGSVSAAGSRPQRPNCAVSPPSTTTLAAVMNEAASDARNVNTRAISSGTPTRPRGCRSMIFCFRSGV